MRVRFAPSPTGYLHVGGARTALFNWLFARRHGGVFLLRIEDTDRERSTPEAVKAIIDGLHWLELDWDEEPLYQSQRSDEHRKLVETLLDKGFAYPCFCDPADLKRAQSSTPSVRTYGYPRTCRNLSPSDAAAKLAAGLPHAIRFKTPEGVTGYTDAVHGPIEIANREIEDFILLRRDGSPVYQVAVVTDDVHMGITHIIRGDDHISNTPKQILIYRALGLEPPQFAHVPLILGPDKKRLSKRHGATSVTEYRDRGILPGAMRNFLALLGWSPGEDLEIMDTVEMISRFDLKAINAAGAVFDESKLDWMNGRYIAALSDEQIWDNIRPYLSQYCRQKRLPEPDGMLGLRLASLFRERLRRFTEAPEKMIYFFEDPVSYDEKGLKKHWKTETPDQLRGLLTALSEVTDWCALILETVFENYIAGLDMSRGEIIHPVRLALTGGIASPGIYEVMELLGREVCLKRITSALGKVN
ncbi:MAG: glutamate--tRNA ligase [bacterium]|nr:glutamate--tRNA ligase [bacterium]